MGALARHVRGTVVSPSKQIWVGLGRRRTYLFRWFLEIFGAIWLVIEAASFLAPSVRLMTEGNDWLLLAAVAIAAVGVVVRAWEPTSAGLALHGTNSVVVVRFGDLFEPSSDHLAVPVNDGFDGELGLAVAPRSVHGQYIQRFHHGNQRDFEAACDAKLCKATSTPSGRNSRELAYPIGTTVALPLEGRTGFLFALARTDAATLKARADIPTMWVALAELWKSVRNQSNGHPVRLPLVGAGQSGVGIEPMQLLQLIVLSFVVATREGEVCKRIIVVLHPDLFEKIDLRMMQKLWS
jgi:hypothetical protein